jgi:DNA-binding transcriptional LysR family regulator
MDDLRPTLVFTKVAQHRSFTLAAAELGLTRSMVSQYLRRLEEQLDVRLVTRTTRRVALTEAGAQYYATCRAAFTSLAEATERLREAARKPRGRLRVAAPVDLGSHRLAALVAEFGRAYPDVELELVLEDGIADLVAAEIDVAVRVGWLRSSSLHAVRIAHMEPWLCAAPALLARHGSDGPRTPAELVRWPCVVLTILPHPTRWTFTRGGARQTVELPTTMKTNSPTGLLGLVLAGAGLGLCPDYQAREHVASGRLVRLLPSHALKRGGIYAVNAYGRRPPARVAAFVTFLRQHWAEGSGAAT